MQTYTHVAIGAVVGEFFFPGNYIAEAVCVVASAVPDLTMVPQYGLDLLRGRQPMMQQSSRLMLAKEVGHSLPVWALLGAAVMLLSPAMKLIVVAAATGGLLHVIVDILTHGTGPKEKRPHWDTDMKFMWPTRFDLRPLGVWEYRIGHGILQPKPFELCVLLVSLVITILLLTH